MHTRALCFLLGLSLIAATSHSAASDQPVFAFVKKHCVACHNAKKSSGDLDLLALQRAGRSTFDQSREAWERVVGKLQTGEMPPPKATQPPLAEVRRVTDWLSAEFARQDRMIEPQAGRVTARRLNRTEYSHTIRDLLGVNIRPAADFPPDQTAFGFDNNSDALRLSPVLLEKYLNAAERAVRTALFGPARLAPAIVHYPLPVRINLSRGQETLPPDLFDYDQSGLSMVYSAHVTHYFPVDGEYQFRIVLNGHRPNQSEPAHPAHFQDGVLAQEFEVDATDLEGQFVETRLPVEAGEHLLSVAYLKVFHGLPPKYGGPAPSQRDPAALLSNNARGKLTAKDIEVLRKLGTKIKTDGVETRVDNRFESIDIGGPFKQRTRPQKESLDRIFGCGHGPEDHTEDCAREIITNFAQRAYRRPARAGEVDNLLRLVALVQREGDSWEEGIATALQAILISPHFLFRIEQDASAAEGKTAAPLTDHELAARLSYFLWSSTPDDKLLQLAEDQELRHPDVLADQVRRMLKDRKSRALVENFAGQWLQFTNIDVVKPDVRTFPQFEESLRRSMRRETERFLEEIIRADRSVLELLDANYTFLDERLARFYGIENVKGSQFRKVDVGSTRRGGGLLSHASILTITSYATRTSPVLRGKWILENLLNAPPPPPPPSVPALEETASEPGGTLRQQLEAHRSNTACAGCHARLDPLGFALEHFDAIGGWRDMDGKAAVDASGHLPSGQSFQGHAELKQILLTERQAFLQCLTEKLLVYALGRGLQRYDRPTLAKITDRLSTQEHRFSELVLGIVKSMPFQMRNTVARAPAAAK